MSSWILWAASFLMPAVAFGPETLYGKPVDPTFCQGWQALWFSIWFVFAFKDSGWAALPPPLMGLTNLIILLSPIAVFSRKVLRRRVLSFLAVAATAWNAAARLWIPRDLRPSFAVGYWAWLASFALLAIALWGLQREPVSDPAASPR